MKTPPTLLFLTFLLCVRADIIHEDIRMVGCSETEGEFMYGLDGEERWYADFIKEKGVIALPPFADQVDVPAGYEAALANREICKENLRIDRIRFKNPPLKLVAPHSIIFTRDVVEVGEENLLICHVIGFFPAPVTVGWTKNNINVTQDSSLKVPFPNKDGTFNQFSSLKFTPQSGDIYSCSVEHRSLEKPLTRFYDVEHNQPSVGPDVFCGLGLTVGLVGVATGTFFLIKGNQCN